MVSLAYKSLRDMITSLIMVNWNSALFNFSCTYMSRKARIKAIIIVHVNATIRATLHYNTTVTL